MTKDEALERRELGLNYEPAQEYERGIDMQKQMQSSVDSGQRPITSHMGWA
jgi:hypothetical protein